MEITEYDKFSKLQAIGGGYITENFPTFDRHFWTQKLLSKKENVDMYRDATASEKSAWDKKYPNGNDVPGRTDLTVLYEQAGAVFNDRTGYYELNGLTDLTEEDMAVVYAYGKFPDFLNQCCHSSAQVVKTHPRTTIQSVGKDMTIDKSFTWIQNTEVVHFGIESVSRKPVFTISLKDESNFSICSHSLTAILDRLTPDNNVAMIGHASANSLLENLSIIFIYKLAHSIKLYIPAMSEESLMFLVENASNTSPITVTLWHTAFDRLTGELLDLAEEKQISFASYTPK